MVQIQNNIDDTFDALINAYYTFLDLFDLSEDDVIFDEEKIIEVCERYLMDVDRLLRYHYIERIDCHKIAGYLTYWICKIKPLQIRDSYNKEVSALREANELLAIIVSVGRINENHIGEGRQVLVKQEFLEAFIYTLRYRPLNGDLLSIIYYFVDVSCVL